MKKLIRNLILSITAIFIFTGCGAESELEDMGISYTQDDYFKHGVYKQNLAVLGLFYEAGMPIEAEDKNKNTALDNAIYKGHIQLIKFLIEEHGAKINNKTFDYFLGKYARKNNGKKVVEYLISKGAKFTDEGALRASNSIFTNTNYDIDLALLLAQNNASAKSSDLMLYNVYMYALRHLKIVKENQNADKISLLIDTLIKNGADPKNALKYFVGKNYAGDRGKWLINYIKPLIDNGYDINEKSIRFSGGKYTILSAFSYLGLNKFDNSKDTLKYLFENGADPKIKTKGKDALYRFCILYDPKDKESLKYSLVCRKGGYDSFKLLYINQEEYIKQNKEFNLKYRQ